MRKAHLAENLQQKGFGFITFAHFFVPWSGLELYIPVTFSFVAVILGLVQQRETCQVVRNR